MKKILAIVFIVVSCNIQAQLKINEIMATNVSAVWDNWYNFTNWIELYNPTGMPVFQNDYALTDDMNEPRKWQLHYKSIPAKGFALLWMERPEREFHSPFKLKPGGGSLYLVDWNNEIIDQFSYPAQFRNTSFGRKSDGADELVFFEDHSPGSSNNGRNWSNTRCIEPVPTVAGGLYPSELAVAFEAPQPGDTIIYTLNGDEPTRNNAIRYQPGSTLQITNNTVIRAITIGKGKLASDITTASYLIGQREFNLPVVSLVTSPKFLFDNTIGIYVEGTNGIEGCGDPLPHNWNQDWDRPANFELFDRSKLSRLNQEIDIQTAGCGSRANNRQKSLHIKPKNKFGDNTLNYPIFGSRPNKKYKDIALRNSGNDHKYSMMRDGMMQSLIIGRMDLEYLAYEPAVLFINGEYCGIQNLRERSNADLLYATHGYDEEDIIKIDTYDIVNHPLYQELIGFVSNNDITQNAVYEQVKQQMDVENYIQNIITHIFVANYDWPHNNVKMWKPIENGKWRWILYDTDFGFNLFIDNLHDFNSLTYALGENNGFETQPWATELFRRLMQNPTFRNDFIDRFTVHLSSTFKSERVIHIIDSIAARIRPEIGYHKQRWDSERDFETDINLMKTFANARPGNMYRFIGDRFLPGTALHTIRISSNIPSATFTYNTVHIPDPSIELQSFKGRSYTLKANEVSGYVFKRWEVTGVNHSTLPWDSEWKYWDSSTVPAANWYEPGYSDATWKKGPAQFGYGNKGETTVVDYGPNAADKFTTSYYRKNFSISNPANLSKATIRMLVDDGAVIYLNGVELSRYNMPEGTINFQTYALTANNGDYVDIEVPFSMLAKGTNIIAVEVHQANASSSDLIFNLELLTENNTSTGGDLTENEISTTLTNDQQLVAIYEEDDSIDPLDQLRVTINEILSSNSVIRDEFGDKDDYIELYNAGDHDVNISGWYVSDKKGIPDYWQIPTDAAAVIPSGAYLLLWADEHPFQGALHMNFKLSASGEFLSLYARNKFGTLVGIDSISFPALPANQSYSRMPDGSENWTIKAPTPSASNLLSATGSETAPHYKVYPTRITDVLHIEQAHGQLIQLYTLTGKKVFQNVNHDPHVTIATSHLPAGIYLLKVGEKSFKLIK